MKYLWHRLYVSTVTITDNLEESSTGQWEYQLQVVIYTECIPSCRVRLRLRNSLSTMLQHPLQPSGSTTKVIGKILHNIKNIAPRRTVTSAVSSGTSIHFSSRVSFPQRFRGRTNDTVSGPRSRHLWRVNQRGSLVHRQRRFRNACQIEQAEREPRLIERPHERANKYPRWQFHAKLGG